MSKGCVSHTAALGLTRKIRSLRFLRERADSIPIQNAAQGFFQAASDKTHHSPSIPPISLVNDAAFNTE